MGRGVHLAAWGLRDGVLQLLAAVWRDCNLGGPGCAAGPQLNDGERRRQRERGPIDDGRGSELVRPDPLPAEHKALEARRRTSLTRNPL